MSLFGSSETWIEGRGWDGMGWDWGFGMAVRWWDEMGGWGWYWINNIQYCVREGGGVGGGKRGARGKGGEKKHCMRLGKFLSAVWISGLRGKLVH